MAIPMCDEWNLQHRSEAPLQRADRNFAELLQELRVLLTSVHILFGFLLALTFSARFGALDGFQHGVFVVTLLAAALSSALLVAPVAAHRVLFRRGRKRELVTAGHRAASAGVAGLALTLVSALLLVLDLTAGRVTAVAAAAVLVVTVLALWLAMPLRMRRARVPEHDGSGCRTAEPCDRRPATAAGHDRSDGPDRSVRSRPRASAPVSPSKPSSCPAARPTNSPERPTPVVDALSPTSVSSPPVSRVRATPVSGATSSSEVCGLPISLLSRSNTITWYPRADGSTRLTASAAPDRHEPGGRLRAP